MFGVSIPEVFIIMVIALIVIGPEKLPKIAGTIGKVMREFRGVVNNVKRSIEEEESNLETAAKNESVSKKVSSAESNFDNGDESKDEKDPEKNKSRKKNDTTA